MTTASVPLGTAPAARAGWFRSAPYDLLLILGVPLVTWPLLMAGKNAFGPDRMRALILLTATGHYFATFVRAYGDLDLFRRFRLRFVLVPLLLLAMCVGMFTTGHEAQLMLVVTAWAFWHWLAQAFGFARIYDSKVGSFRPWTAFLDKALVVAGFTATVMLNPGSTQFFAKAFLDAGVPLPGADAFAVVKTATAVLAGLVLVAYVANLGLTIARRRPWSWQKQLMHVSSIGYYWFAFSYLPSILIAYVLYEFFHDVQYYAITWLTCGQRARRPGVAPWFAAMFKPSFATAALFVAAMCAFGGFDVLARGSIWPEGTANATWRGIVITLALLHYYYDGFIWKARENTLAKDLGIATGRGDAMVPALRHGAWFLFFFVPPFLLIWFGRPPADELARLAAVVAVAPGDFETQSLYGRALTGARDLPAALEHHRQAIALNPDFAPSHFLYGSTLDLAGDTKLARAEYERALALPDLGDTHRQAHVRLGTLLLVAGERSAAEPHLRAGQEDPTHLLVSLADAIPPDAHDRRVQLLAAALSLHPNDAQLRYLLAVAQAAAGRLDDARANLRQVVQQLPNHGGAQALLQRLGG